jgi:hypothetical protein
MQQRYTQALQEAIDSEIRLLHDRIDETATESLRSAITQRQYGRANPALQPYGALPPLPNESPTSTLTLTKEAISTFARGDSDAREAVVALDQRIARLEEVRDWMSEDRGIASLIENVIEQQAKGARRRHRVISTLVVIIALASGWILALLSLALFFSNR